jgi:Phycobilisome degradation protein nblA
LSINSQALDFNPNVL